MKAQLSRSRRGRVVPQVEALEDRQALSCTVGVSNGVMTITGDGGANSVQINQTFLGQVKVKADGVTTTASGIQEIKINTLAGNDTVKYILNPIVVFLPTTPQTASQKVVVNLGTGNDKFQTAMCAQHLQGNASLSFDVKGWWGNDTIRVDMYSNAVAVDYGASVNMKLDGGMGGDTIVAKYRGELDGHLSIDAIGGPKGTGLFGTKDSKDLITVDVLLTTGPFNHSEGLAYLRARGGNGWDNLILKARKQSSLDPAAIDAQGEGDEGHDRLIRTSNVKNVSCELDFIV
jgi:hypothetical protein